jgi:hypothetical protein
MLGSLSLLCIYMLAINEPKSNLDFYEYNNNEWLTPLPKLPFSLPFRGDDVLLKAIISRISLRPPAHLNGGDALT